MKLSKWLDRCIVESPYRYTLCTTQQMLDAQLKKLHIANKFDGVPPGKSACVHFLTPLQVTPIAIVCIFNSGGFHINSIHALLLHEAIHIWQRIEDSLGEEKSSREFEAYSVQRIAQELFYEYERQTKGVKRAKTK